MLQRAKEYLTDPSDFATKLDLALALGGLAIAWSSEIPALREDHKKAFMIFCAGAICWAPVASRALRFDGTQDVT